MKTPLTQAQPVYTREALWTTDNLSMLRRLKLSDLSMRIALLEQVANESQGDPRLTVSGGVLDQIEVLRHVRAESIPPVVVGLKTLDLRAERG